ncbi:MAG: sugar ABC transporter ATP-binding protein, partial [Myxococcales bacterium]|nr:sugar ABC transporter ATP-binding protein [Myxococcales bacterium]
GAVALRVADLRAGERVRGVSFSVRRGEILGIAGLVGSGRTETLRALFGADPKTGGDVFIGSASIPVNIRHPHDAVRLGLGLIPEDRKKDGLLLSLGIAVNAGLSVLARESGPAGWFSPHAESLRVTPVCDEVGVRRASLEQAGGELSGGNQQKVVLARWLLRDCDVLLVDEPTRGIDTTAKLRVHELLRDLAARGKAVVVVSSETSELFAVCDRIVVMSAGRIAAELAPDDWSEAALLRASFSGYVSSPASSLSA